MVVDDRAAELEGVGEFSVFNCEFAGQQGKALDFLKTGQSSLQALDAFGEELADFAVVHQVFNTAE